MERREWSYVETRYAARINCGDFELRPQWDGALKPDMLREAIRRGVDVYNQHDALIAQRDRLAAALQGLRLGNKCWCRTWVGGEHEPECQIVIDALATVEQGRDL